jgi:hypothetical protein
MATKIATSFRLSEEALTLIRELSERLGISQADVVRDGRKAPGRREAAAARSNGLGLIEGKRTEFIVGTHTYLVEYPNELFLLVLVTLGMVYGAEELAKRQ